MELDLQSLFGLHVHSCTRWLRPHNSPPPHLGTYTRPLLVSQDRRHLSVTPWFYSLLWNGPSTWFLNCVELHVQSGPFIWSRICMFDIVYRTVVHVDGIESTVEFVSDLHEIYSHIAVKIRSSTV